MQLSRYMDLVACQLSTATTNEVEINTDNCEGVVWIGIPGTTAARTWSLAFAGGATTTGFVAVSSTHTHASSGAANQCIITDVYHPGKRYLRGELSSTTATPSWLLAFKYGLRKGELTSTGFSSTAGISAVSGGIKRLISPSSAT